MKILESAVALVMKTNDQPCLLRCMDAAAIAGGLTDKEEIISAAFLCGAYEKGIVSEQEAEVSLVKKCAEQAVSEQSVEKWHVERQKMVDFVSAANENEKIVVLSNRLADLRKIYRDYLQVGDAVWGNLVQKDKFMHAWYYRELLVPLSNFRNSAAYKEFSTLVEQIFESQFDL